VGHQRNAWLDTLRAVAIALVVACHVNSAYFDRFEKPSHSWYKIVGLGGHGVDLFFVLSGWLLGSALLRELNKTGSVDPLRFWHRRWWRTLPAYFAVLFFTLSQRALSGNLSWSDSTYFVFIQNYWYKHTPFFGVSWSLCVEEHFYLLIAASLFFVGNRKKAITALLLALIFVPIYCRAQGLFTQSLNTHVQIDACASGVLLAHIMQNYPDIWKNWMRTLVAHVPMAIAVLLIAAYRRFYAAGPELPPEAWIYVSMVAISLSELNPFFRNSSSNAPIRYLATRSYALYLVHVEGIALANILGIKNYWLYFAVVVVAGLIIAEILHRFVEVPGMNYRDSAKHKQSTANIGQDMQTAKLSGPA